MFAQAYQALNAEQKKAVDTIEGPVMVIAGPGTGKTTILTLRIANILERTDTPASGILAITFTEAGAKAMRAKLKSIIGERAHDVRIQTFHGFAASVIAEFSDHFVHLDGVRQMTDVEAEQLIRAILQHERFRLLRPYANPDFYLSKLLGAISDAKREGYTPEMVRVFVKEETERIHADTSIYSTRGATKGELKADAKKTLEKCERTLVFADLYEAYEAEKRAQKYMDFDDLLTELVVALKSDELLLRMLQEKFLYIHIDEHQDTNNIQNEVITLLANFFDIPNVFIVGDEKQAIYRFQGASVENFLSFKKVWKDIVVINLVDNYRSHQSILDAAGSMIAHNDSGLVDIQLRASGNGKPRPVDIISAPDTASEEEHVIARLKEITAQEPDKSVAIIVKTNRDLERIIELCESAGVPISSERSIDIFGSPIGNLFFDLIECIEDPARSDLVAKTVAAGLWDMSLETGAEVIKKIRSGNEYTIPVWHRIQKALIDESPVSAIISIAQLSTLETFIVTSPTHAEIWHGIVALAQHIVTEANITNPHELLQRLIAYRASAQHRSVKVPIGTPDLPIKAMTAHGSKGLEFDYVFIPYAQEESWIGRNWGNYFVLPETRTSNDIADIRRLFYVALTRAKKHVVISQSATGSRETLTPLRFIDELAGEHIARAAVEKIEKQERPIPRRVHSAEEKIISYTKHVLQTSGLSVTALNHFLTCPSQFFYLSILKLPQKPSAIAEKGTAMHAAFAAVWAASEKSVGHIEEILRTTINHFFKTSLLPLFEKNAVKKELDDSIPTVVRELHEHFAQLGTVFSEKWVEREYVHTLATIPIHGKLDLLIEHEGRALVYDYKTKKAMTKNDIMGLTKASDGGYFRQLVFYNYLLQEKYTAVTPALVFVTPPCEIVTLPVEQKNIDILRKDIDTLLESVWSGAFVREYCDDVDCQWCNLKKIAL